MRGEPVDLQAGRRGAGHDRLLVGGRGQRDDEVRARPVPDDAVPGLADRRHDEGPPCPELAPQPGEVPAQRTVGGPRRQHRLPGGRRRIPVARRVSSTASRSGGGATIQPTPSVGVAILLAVPRCTTTSGASAASTGSGATS